MKREKSVKKITRMINLKKLSLSQKCLEGIHLKDAFDVSPQKKKCCLIQLVSTIKNEQANQEMEIIQEKDLKVLFPVNSKSTGDLWNHNDLRVD
jgi:hypothetical protein